MNQASQTLKNINPRHLLVYQLHARGLFNKDIAWIVGIAESTVSMILGTPIAKELFNEMQAIGFDTIADVQQMVQVAAPAIIQEKVRLALSATDERVRSTSCMDILAIAGHKPISRVVIEQPSLGRGKYEGLGEEELRMELLKSVKAQAPKAAETVEMPEHETVQ